MLKLNKFNHEYNTRIVQKYKMSHFIHWYLPQNFIPVYHLKQNPDNYFSVSIYLLIFGIGDSIKIFLFSLILLRLGVVMLHLQTIIQPTPLCPVAGDMQHHARIERFIIQRNHKHRLWIFAMHFSFHENTFLLKSSKRNAQDSSLSI